ncbi:nucleotidyltransferase family protein [Radiobacillus deserti]|nr:nucleotidyltransferase domain-containing protein [Radiobacillus deserti]
MRENILKELKTIILNVLKEENVKVYLFGSWARQEEKNSSDIDIAVESRSQISLSKWAELLEKVEESTIPYHVDIVNMDDASMELKENVRKEGVEWKDCSKE